MPDILKQPLINRQKFDPTNDSHLASFEVFMRTGNWGDIQFFTELPYNEVPMTVLMKYAEHMSGVSRESVAERNARIDAKPGIMHLPPFEMPSVVRARRKVELAEINSRLKDNINSMIRAST